MKVVIQYKDNKNSFLEEKIESLALSYRGEKQSDFQFNDGFMGAIYSFDSENQLLNFEEELKRLTHKLNIECMVSGFFEL